jgi:antitoxin YefM
MQAVYRLNIEDLDTTFLEAIKTMFQGRDVEIIITATDETAYLLSSPANRKRLLSAVENVTNGVNLVEVDLENTL